MWLVRQLEDVVCHLWSRVFQKCYRNSLNMRIQLFAAENIFFTAAFSRSVTWLRFSLCDLEMVSLSWRKFIWPRISCLRCDWSDLDAIYMTCLLYPWYYWLDPYSLDLTYIWSLWLLFIIDFTKIRFTSTLKLVFPTTGFTGLTKSWLSS